MAVICCRRIFEVVGGGAVRSGERIEHERCSAAGSDAVGGDVGDRSDDDFQRAAGGRAGNVTKRVRHRRNAAIPVRQRRETVAAIRLERQRADAGDQGATADCAGGNGDRHAVDHELGDGLAVARVAVGVVGQDVAADRGVFRRAGGIGVGDGGGIGDDDADRRDLADATAADGIAEAVRSNVARRRGVGDRAVGVEHGAALPRSTDGRDRRRRVFEVVGCGAVRSGERIESH
jgi:hypothetical protein